MTQEIIFSDSDDKRECGPCINTSMNVALQVLGVTVCQGSPTKTPTAWQAHTSLESKVRRTSASTLRCYHYAEEYERALLSRVVDEVVTILNFPDIAIRRE